MTNLTLPEILINEDITLADLEEAAQAPWEKWHHQCHVISLRLVRSRIFDSIGATRVTRGSARTVGLNHSWISLDTGATRPEDVNGYSSRTLVLDPTLWSYDDAAPLILLEQPYGEWDHVPHNGAGSLFDSAYPEHHGGETIELTPETPLSDAARRHLEMFGPLDRRGWTAVSGAPVLGWPAAEIITAMYQTDALRALIPVDVVGNLTTLNPNKLYW